MTPHEALPKKSVRGFASMDAAKQREIASKGGHAAHQKGTAHQFTSEEAREAGRKGGGAVSEDRQHMADIGRLGGQARGQRRRASTPEQSPPRGAADATDEPEPTRRGEDAETDVKEPPSRGDYRH
jgi:general stress protein YciG